MNTGRETNPKATAYRVFILVVSIVSLPVVSALLLGQGSGTGGGADSADSPTASSV